MKGEIVLTFHDGRLFNINFRLSAPLNPEQIETFKRYIPFTMAELTAPSNYNIGLYVEPIIMLPAMEKMDLFTKAYLHYVGVEYLKQKRDHLFIKNFDVTESLLKTYFTSVNVLFKGNYSIGNYCKFYNQLRAENAGKQKTYPDRYDVNFIRTLKTPQELMDYYAHLRSRGLKAVVNKTGQVVDFVKPDNAQS
jgi:hypothetical protein